MPRGKKPETKNKKGKYHEEDDSIDDIIEEDELEEATPKKASKKSKKSSKGKKKQEEEEDELSEIEVDDEDNAEDEDNVPVETADNDQVVSTQKQKTPIKKIDPKIPVGELKANEILSYLIQLGDDNLNPTLKRGALNLLLELTGRRRRHPMSQGQMRGRYNSYNPHFANRGRGRGGVGQMGRGHGQQMQTNTMQPMPQNLYPDEDE